MDALKGRPIYPGRKERADILLRGIKLREEVKAFRLKHKIEDPPQHADKNIKEVSYFNYSQNRENRVNVNFNDYDQTQGQIQQMMTALL